MDTGSDGRVLAIATTRRALAVLVLSVSAACSSSVTPTAFPDATPTPSATTTQAPTATRQRPTQTPSQRPTPTLTPTPTASPTSGCGAVAPPIVWDGGPLGCTGPPPFPPAGTRLPPNYYISHLVEPRVGFLVGRGWTTEQQMTGFFDIQDDPGSLDVVAVQFANVVGADTAAEAAEQITERDDLVIEGPTDVEINGRAAIRLTVESTDPLDTDPPVFHPVLIVAAGPLAIASARRLQINLFDVEDGVLAVLVGGSVEKWDRALRMSVPVLESLSILE